MVTLFHDIWWIAQLFFRMSEGAIFTSRAPPNEHSLQVHGASFRPEERMSSYFRRLFNQGNMLQNQTTSAVTGTGINFIAASKCSPGTRSMYSAGGQPHFVSSSLRIIGGGFPLSIVSRTRCAGHDQMLSIRGSTSPFKNCSTAFCANDYARGSSMAERWVCPIRSHVEDETRCQLCNH